MWFRPIGAVLLLLVGGCAHQPARVAHATRTAPRCSLPAELDVDCACTRPDCLLKLGVIYSEAIDVRRDDARARALFARACDGGNTLACNNLASLLAEARGGPRDDARAANLYERVCRAHDPIGCFNLGILYLVARGRPRDDTMAALLFDQACTRGVAQACVELGVQYARGDGTPVDLRQSMQLFERGCADGDARGCADLATMQRVAPTPGFEEWLRALRRDCDAGDSTACRRFR